MTNPFDDITNGVDAILLIGSNPEEAHPVFGTKIRKAVREGAKLIVADPRKIDLAHSAEVHLQLKPGTNVAFANGMMNVILNEGLADEEFIRTRTENFEQLKPIILEYPPEKVAEICGIDAEDLRKAARLYAKADKAPLMYCLGVTEHSTGTEGVMSLSNLAMLCGKVGKSGCGVNPIRGQNNVQGACDMGCLPADYPGYQKVENPAAKEKFEKAWGVSLSGENGLTSTQIPHAVEHGRIKGLYIFGEDPMRTDPDLGHIHKMLSSLEFLVVQELFLTETAKHAHVVLPGSAYAEKEGTFTNSERRLQRVRKAVNAPGEARLDTDIFVDVMNRLGYKQAQITASQLMDELALLTPSYGGFSHKRLDGGEALHWPCLNEEHPGTPILHIDKCSRGLGLFYPLHYEESAEVADDNYPYTLVTGRMLYHYNAGAMTQRTEGLNEIAPASYVEMHCDDAKALGVADGGRVRIASRRGEIETTARLGEKVRRGEIFMTFHFEDGNANHLTNSATDKMAKVPEYKVTAVRIERA